MITDFKKFIALPRYEKHLLMEALVSLFWARLLLLCLPFRKIAPRMGKAMGETEKGAVGKQARELKSVQQALRRAVPLVPGRRHCLTKALAGRMMLARRSIACTIYLGMIKDATRNHRLSAHAWLRSGDMFVTGTKGVDLTAYVVVSMFASKKAG